MRHDPTERYGAHQVRFALDEIVAGRDVAVHAHAIKAVLRGLLLRAAAREYQP